MLVSVCTKAEFPFPLHAMNTSVAGPVVLKMFTGHALQRVAVFVHYEVSVNVHNKSPPVVVDSLHLRTRVGYVLYSGVPAT